jgi:hypothetical protein
LKQEILYLIFITCFSHFRPRKVDENSFFEITKKKELNITGMDFAWIVKQLTITAHRIQAMDMIDLMGVIIVLTALARLILI